MTKRSMRTVTGAMLLVIGLAVAGAALAQDENTPTSQDEKAAAAQDQNAPAAQDQNAPAEAAPAVQVDLAFGTGVDKTTRSLEGEAATFAADSFSAEEGSVFCLSRVRGMTTPGTITHVWYHDGKTMAKVDLNVGSADWRTWSSKRILPSWTGNWEVKVLDASGMVLASATFTVE